MAVRGWTKRDLDALRDMTIAGDDIATVAATLRMPVESVAMRLSWLRDAGEVPPASQIIPRAQRLPAPPRRPTRPAPYFWSVEREDALVRMRADRVPDDRIAEALGITEKAIKCKAKLLRKAGIEVALKVRPTEETANALERMRRVGVPEDVIAETLGVSREGLTTRVTRLRERGYRIPAAMNHYRLRQPEATGR